MAEPATVTSTAPLMVKVDGSVTSVPALRLAWYTPTLNDRVSVDRQGSQLLVLGRFL